MQYQITGQFEKMYSFSEMIRESVPREGGLFVPTELPSINLDFITSLRTLSFQDRAASILSLFAPELSADQINSICQKAFNPILYPDNLIYDAKPLSAYLTNPVFVFADKGPSTCYTDLTHALSIACLEELIKPEEQWFIIGGESIQSIKSLAAFHSEESVWKPILLADRKATNNFILKEIQNVHSSQVILNPDQPIIESAKDSDELIYDAKSENQDALTQNENQVADDLLKIYTLNGRVQECEYFPQSLFYNQKLRQKLSDQNKYIASVGSINFVHHLALYILLLSSYVDFLEAEILEESETFALAFPNLNLDFIYTAQLLKKSGLPISHLFAASNNNRAVDDFFRRGKYKLKRRFFRTNTPALDQVYFPNLERVLFEVAADDSSTITEIINKFFEQERLEIPKSILDKFSDFIQTGYANNAQTISQIKEWYLKTDYLLDPYTALTLDVVERFEQLALKMNKIIIPVIENPLISAQASAEAILDSNKSQKRNYSQLLKDLSEESGIAIPNAAISGKVDPETINLDIAEMTEQIATDLFTF